MYMLAAFRAVQGLGAGGLFSLALGDHRRHRAAPRTGPLPGLLPGRVRHVERARPGDRRLLRRADTILRITGWRWVFLVNVRSGSSR
jgi:hypothetical protein